MNRLKVTAHIFVETEEDPEELGTNLDTGMTSALAHYPGGEIVAANVEGITPASDDEVRDYFEEA